MFACLPEYQTQKYYETHPVLYLYTPGHRYTLELIAGYTTDTTDPIYSFPVTEQNREAILEHAGRLSTFSFGITLGVEDCLVTLSTGSYASEDARYVMSGRLVEE